MLVLRFITKKMWYKVYGEIAIINLYLLRLLYHLGLV